MSRTLHFHFFFMSHLGKEHSTCKFKLKNYIFAKNKDRSFTWILSNHEKIYLFKRKKGETSLHLNSIPVAFAMLLDTDRLYREWLATSVPEEEKKGVGGHHKWEKARKKQPCKQQRQTKNCKKVINKNKKHPKRCRSQVIFQSKCQHFHLS